MFVFRVFLDETLKRIFIPQWGLSFFLVQLSNHKIPQCYRRRRGLQIPRVVGFPPVVASLGGRGGSRRGRLGLAPSHSPSFHRASAPTFFFHPWSWRPLVPAASVRLSRPSNLGVREPQNPGDLCTGVLSRPRKTRAPGPGKRSPPLAMPGDSLEPPCRAVGPGRRGSPGRRRARRPGSIVGLAGPAAAATTLIFQKSSRKVETLLGGRWPFKKTARKDFRPFERT